MATPITFTLGDLDASLQRISPALADSSTFTARRTEALKMALAQQQVTYMGTNDPYMLRDTFGLAGAIPVLGTAIFTNSVGEIFRIALPTDGQRVSGNTVWLQNSTVLIPVPRLTIDAETPLSGTGAITLGFTEVKGEIILYAGAGLFTGTSQLHFYYEANLTIAAVSTDIIDVLPQDYPAFVQTVAGYLVTD